MTIGIDECDVSRHHIRQVPEALQRKVQNGNFGAEPSGHFRGVDSYDTASENHNLRGSNAGHSSKENSASAIKTLQILGALLNSHSPGDFRHRGQQRKLSRRKLDSFVGNAGRAAFYVSARKCFVGGKMEVREDRLPFPHSRPFAPDRLLHFHYHVRLAPDGWPVTRDARSNVRVIFVRKAAALARALLDQNIVTGGDESLRAGGNERDAILVCLDFLWNADLHGLLRV